jgi:hypothetical protein
MDLQAPQLVECHHCRNVVMHQVVYAEVFTYDLADIFGTEVRSLNKDTTCTDTTALLKCSTCRQLSLVSLTESKSLEHSHLYRPPFANLSPLVDAYILHPAQKRLRGGLPSEVFIAYEQAKKIRSISPVAFTILLRRMLELICEDQKVAGKTLYEKLRNLHSTGIFSRNVLEAIDMLRQVGNAAAHTDKNVFRDSNLEFLETIFLTLTDVLYDLPEMVRVLREAMSESK